MNIIEKAQAYAHGAHDAVGQTRKYTGEKYWVHVDEVAAIITDLLTKQKGQPGNFKRAMTMIPAAFLHDAAEDTKVTAQDLEREFGAEVAALVVELTDVFTPEKYQDLGRAQRKRLEAERIAHISPDAKTIKLADLLSNTASIVDNDPKFAATYLREKMQVMEGLKEGDAGLYALVSAQLSAALEKLGLEF